MIGFLDVVNTVGVIGATVISTITLFTTRALQRTQQKASVMATKRSERIDLMREFSAEIISHGKHILYGIGNAETKGSLISYTDKFIALLQYEYEHDVELIDCANDIVEISLAEVLDKGALKDKLTLFWKMCDIYIGVEYERLKLESIGEIHGSGKVKDETERFENIYSVLVAQQKEYFPSDK